MAEPNGMRSVVISAASADKGVAPDAAMLVNAGDDRRQDTAKSCRL